MFYLHPWEIDPDQPRITSNCWKSRFRHYVGLRGTEAKFRGLVRPIRFGTLTATLSDYHGQAASKTSDEPAEINV